MIEIAYRLFGPPDEIVAAGTPLIGCPPAAARLRKRARSRTISAASQPPASCRSDGCGRARPPRRGRDKTSPSPASSGSGGSSEPPKPRSGTNNSWRSASASKNGSHRGTRPLRAGTARSGHTNAVQLGSDVPNFKAGQLMACPPLLSSAPSAGPPQSAVALCPSNRSRHPRLGRYRRAARTRHRRLYFRTPSPR